MLRNYLSVLLFLSGVFLSYSQQANDCVDAILVCGNSTISTNATGFGVQELDRNENPCLFEEVNSLWLRVIIAQSGTLEFTIRPDSEDLEVDYDFFVFGPSDTCGNFNDPIRCSTTNPLQAGLSNNLTGLSNTEIEANEGPAEDGNSFVTGIDVIAGESYYMLIDRPVGQGGFSLEWQGTAEFLEKPEIDKPDDIDLCYTSAGATYNLLSNPLQISGLAAGGQVAYFETNANAFDNINPIADPANYLIPDQASTTIYVRATGANSCFDIATFDFNLDYILASLDLSYTECDQDGDGNATFDLDQIEVDIANLLDTPALYDINFHLDSNSAETNSAALVGPTFLGNTSTLYTRISTIADPTCFVVHPIMLNVEQSPIPLSLSLLQCDIDTQNSTDGITTFNLNQVFAGLPDLANYDVFFYATIADRNNNNPITQLVGFSNTTPFNQDIYYRVIDNVLACENLGTLQLAVQPTITSLNPQSPFYTCDDDPNDNGLLGTFDIDAIKAQNFPGIDIEFYASIEDASLEINPIRGNYRTASGTFYVRTEVNNQCQGVEEFVLLVNPSPFFPYNDEFIWCTDGPPLNPEVPLGFDEYRWLRIENGMETEISPIAQANINEIGSYVLEVTSDFSDNQPGLRCSSRFEFEVVPSNIASFREINITDLSNNNMVVVNVTGDGNYEYSLDGVNYQTSNSFENVAAGILTVFVRDINGCGIAEQEIAILGFPKFFTPNGDGTNDFWQIIGANALFQPNTAINIYNRFGQLLTQLRPDNRGWDGTFNGKALPASDYWFRINLEDGREFQGHFTLKR